MDRRTFLTTLGGAGTTLALSGQAAAAPIDEYDPPDHVTIEYDESVLSTYQPYLRIEHLDVKPLGMWGMTCSSPEYRDRAHVYACRYTHQEGVSSLAPPLTDSHYGDTEWYYVFERDGRVADVVYTVHHWIADRELAGEFPLYDGTHPMAEVVSPWHNYVLDDVSGSGEFVNLNDMSAPDSGFQSWLEAGMSENIAPGTVRDPWSMRYRGHWWESGFDAWYADLFHSLFG